MTVYLENIDTGAVRTLFRPWAECVSTAFITLGHEDHKVYSPEFKAARCWESGVWIYELDANGKLTQGAQP